MRMHLGFVACLFSWALLIFVVLRTEPNSHRLDKCSTVELYPWPPNLEFLCRRKMLISPIIFYASIRINIKITQIYNYILISLNVLTWGVDERYLLPSGNFLGLYPERYLLHSAALSLRNGSGNWRLGRPVTWWCIPVCILHLTRRKRALLIHSLAAWIISIQIWSMCEWMKWKILFRNVMWWQKKFRCF